MLAAVRERLIKNRTQLSNAIGGHAAEFGVVAPRGLDKLAPLIERLSGEETVPDLARQLFAQLGQEYERLQTELEAVEARFMA